jgi:hypothetical protein
MGQTREESLSEAAAMPKAELFQKAELFELARQVRNYRMR